MLGVELIYNYFFLLINYTEICSIKMEDIDGMGFCFPLDTQFEGLYIRGPKLCLYI